MPPSVELVYDVDCPNVGQARAQLLRAFAAAGLPARWREWRRDHDRAPARVRGLGSPTILINGKDVVPITNEAACCRVYARDGGGMAAVPPLDSITSALSAASREPASWKTAGLWGPALGIAFLPKLICPACWPAYAALVSAMGLPFLLETRFLLPLTVVALGLIVGLLAWRASRRRGHGPMLLGIAAAAVVLIGKFAYNSNPAAYIGASVLFAACVWNSWPRRRSPTTPACPACEPEGQQTPGGKHELQAKD